MIWRDIQGGCQPQVRVYGASEMSPWTLEF